MLLLYFLSFWLQIFKKETFKMWVVGFVSTDVLKKTNSKNRKKVIQTISERLDVF